MLEYALDFYHLSLYDKHNENDLKICGFGAGKIRIATSKLLISFLILFIFTLSLLIFLSLHNQNPAIESGMLEIQLLSIIP